MNASRIALAGLLATLALAAISCAPPGVGDEAVDIAAAPDAALWLPRRGGYLGMSLPAEPKPFPASPWTTPIGPDPAVSPDSPAQIQLLRQVLVERLGRAPTLQINAVRNSAPVHVVDRRTSPILDVPCDSLLPLSLDPDQDGVAEGLPVPDAVWADPSDDSHMIIVDQANRVAYEFWNWRKEGTRLYRAGMMGKWDLAGAGWNVPGSDPYRVRNGATASKLPYIGGLIRYEEVAAGSIGHALQMVVPTTRINEFLAPAVRTDGRNAGAAFIPEGARIQLNPDLDLDALGLSGPPRVIARALQIYGAYVADTASGWAIKAQNLGDDGGAWQQFAGQLSLEGIPIEEFRVLQ